MADELLEAHGYAATPENLETVRRVAHEMMKEAFPTARIWERGFRVMQELGGDADS